MTLKAHTHLRKGDAPMHHFFASSLGEWRVGYDLATLIAAMKRGKLPFNVYLVPGPKDAHYNIEWYCPQVDGTIFLAFYGKGD